MDDLRVVERITRVVDNAAREGGICVVEWECPLQKSSRAEARTAAVIDNPLPVAGRWQQHIHNAAQPAVLTVTSEPLLHIDKPTPNQTYAIVVTEADGSQRRGDDKQAHVVKRQRGSALNKKMPRNTAREADKAMGRDSGPAKEQLQNYLRASDCLGLGWGVEG